VLLLSATSSTTTSEPTPDPPTTTPEPTPQTTPTPTQQSPSPTQTTSSPETSSPITSSPITSSPVGSPSPTDATQAPVTTSPTDVTIEPTPEPSDEPTGEPTEPPIKRQEFSFQGPLTLFAIVATAIFVNYMLEKVHFHAIPESGIMMILGMIAGAIIQAAGTEEQQDIDQFSLDFFSLAFLPAIIFESGFSIKKRGLFRNFGLILSYAVIGTIITAVIVGLALYGIEVSNLPFFHSATPLEAALFGAVLSATDPVATLAVFGQVFGINPDVEEQENSILYDVVFGESVLNDAVAIVLFKALEGFLYNPTLDGPVALGVFLSFLKTGFGSIAIGVGCAMISALLFKYTTFRLNSTFDMPVLYIIAWSAYMLADLAGLSGLFAIFFCGIAMGHYTWYNLSAYSQLTIRNTFKSVAQISDTIVFSYLGMALFAFREVRESFSLPFTCLVLAACLVSRAAHIFPIAWIANTRRKRKLNCREQIMLWWSGLRGAVSFSLALKTIQLKTPNCGMIVSSTLAIALFTTLFQGATSKPMILLLRLNEPQFSPPDPDEPEEGIDMSTLNPGTAPLLDEAERQHGGSTVHLMMKQMATYKQKRGWLSEVDRMFFKPLLCRDPAVTGGYTKTQFAMLHQQLVQSRYKVPTQENSERLEADKHHEHDTEHGRPSNERAGFSNERASSMDRRRSGSIRTGSRRQSQAGHAMWVSGAPLVLQDEDSGRFWGI
jgi:sodium/hydrogen exchanger 8